MDALQSVVSQTFQNFVKATGITGPHVVEVKRFFDMFLGAATTIDHATLYGLFPVCLCFLVVHEHYRALSEGGAFRVGPMFAKVLAVTTLYLSYGRLCSVLLMVGGGGWMASDTYTAVVEGSNTALGQSWGTVSLMSLSSWSEFAVVFVSWFLVVASTLFAYIASYLLSLEQQALSMILLSLGKTALVVSLVPGVTIGKSWARYLASVAAWSTVAGAITALLRYRGGDIGTLMAQGDLVALLKAVAQFVVLGICMLRVPQITSQLVGAGSSVGAAALGMAAAGATVWGMARGEQKRLDERKRTKEQEALAKERQASDGWGGGGGGGGDSGGGNAGGASSNASGGGGDGGAAAAQSAFRPHKVAGAVLKGGLNAIGAMPFGPVSRAADGLRAAAPKLAAVAHKATAAAHKAFADSPEKAARRAEKAPARPLPEGSPGQERAERAPVPGAMRAEDEQNSRDLKAPPMDQSPDALAKTSRSPSPQEAAMLRNASPDLGFEPNKMSNPERRIPAVRNHVGSRFAGWREGKQGQGDFALARKVDEHQLAGKDALAVREPLRSAGHNANGTRAPRVAPATPESGAKENPIQLDGTISRAAPPPPRKILQKEPPPRPAPVDPRALAAREAPPAQKTPHKERPPRPASLHSPAGAARQASLATPDPEPVS